MSDAKSSGGIDSGGGIRSAHPPAVLIGASAGGIKALQIFFEHAPALSGAAYIVVVHSDPEHRSELPRIIAACTRMAVVQVKECERIYADHVYVIPPDRRLTIVDHEIRATEFDEPRGRRSSIDTLFRSVAKRLGDGVAIILSGAGSDGALGVRAVKESGGIIFAQDPAEAEYGSMPRSAIATGVADVVAPVKELAERLTTVLRLKQNTGQLIESPQVDEDLLRRILSHLRARTGHDFSKYKRATVLRRIARRMQVTRAEDLHHYYGVLRESMDEAQALMSDLLISVTTFFRDSESFEQLQRSVIPGLFKHNADSIRVWIAGCASGEETYSLAILLLEEAAKYELRPTIQLFGSDLDARALAAAREGRYPLAIEADVSDERLRRFFTREADTYHVRQELRDIVLFATHDLVKDPPFSHLDLITCRNVMIYLDRELQEQVCATFHYALNPGGYLMLGASESADQPVGLFRLVDRSARLYQSSAANGERPRLLPNLLSPARMREQIVQSGRALNPSAALTEVVRHRRVLEQLAPPSILVDEHHRVLHMSETAGRYLQPAGGPLSGDVVELVRPELRFELRSALHRVFEQKVPTISLPLLVRFNGHRHRVHVHVKAPVEDEASRTAVVMFIEGETVADDFVVTSLEASGEIVNRLTQEVELTQARLRTVREESDTANEELRATNEELQTALRSSEHQLRQQKRLVEMSREPIYIWDFDGGIVDWNRGCAELYGHSRQEAIGKLKEQLLHTAVPGSSLQEVNAQLVARGHWDGELREIAKDGRILIVEAHLDLENVDGKRLVLESTRDVTQRKTLQERQQLLLGELTHRVKNTLAVVQSIAHQTEISSQSPDEFVERFTGRLSALASAHGLLVQSEWQGADLRALTRVQLQPYAGNAQRLRIDGPPVSLPSELATPFALVLHELATNAAKHGALAQQAGRVSVRWDVARTNGQRDLRLVWQESGGAAPVQSPPAGLGSDLIDHAIPGARVRRELHEEGLVCTISLALLDEEMRPKGL